MKSNSMKSESWGLALQPKDILSSNFAGLPKEGFIRLPAVLALFPVSASTWWKGVASGRFPKPTKRFGPRIAAWDVRDIAPLLKENTGGASESEGTDKGTKNSEF